MSGKLMAVEERRLPGGNAGGAVLAEGTVRRPTGPWTPAVHALLRHLEAHGFEGAPRVLGVDEKGREMLSFLPGATIGVARPWPRWVHSDEALVEVGAWLRRYHAAVADFMPPVGAQWRTSYGYRGTVPTVLEAVRARINDHARGLRKLAAAGDPLFARLVE